MLKMWILKLKVFLIGCCAVVFCEETTSYFKPCSRDDLKINECLKQSIQEAVISWSDGIPALGLRRLDPYEQNELVIEYKRNQISGKAILKNLTAIGMRNAKVLGVRSNIQDNSFELEVDLTLNKMFDEAFLKGEGRLNALVLRAGGYFNHTMRDLEFTWKLKGKPVTKKGEKYLKIEKFFMRPEVGYMRVHIPDVTDNVELNKLAYDYVNRNWRLIYRELLPIVEILWGKVCIKYANQLFSKIPYDKLFPPSDIFKEEYFN